MEANAKVTAFDPSTFLATAARGRTVSYYRKNEVVFSQGEPADSLFYIQKGRVKIAVASKQGKEAVVAILGAGEFFGEACLIRQPLRLATAAAIDESTITRLEQTEMQRLLHEEPALAELFLSYLLARNLRVEQDLADQLFNSSEKRLARALLLLANFGKDGKPEPITTRISHETLAEMVGTTRSRVNFFMNKFRKLGFIDYDGHQLQVHRGLLTVVMGDSASELPTP